MRDSPPSFLRMGIVVGNWGHQEIAEVLVGEDSAMEFRTSAETVDASCGKNLGPAMVLVQRRRPIESYAGPVAEVAASV